MHEVRFDRRYQGSEARSRCRAARISRGRCRQDRHSRHREPAHLGADPDLRRNVVLAHGRARELPLRQAARLVRPRRGLAHHLHERAQVQRRPRDAHPAPGRRLRRVELPRRLGAAEGLERRDPGQCLLRQARLRHLGDDRLQQPRGARNRVGWRPPDEWWVAPRVRPVLAHDQPRGARARSEDDADRARSDVGLPGRHPGWLQGHRGRHQGGAGHASGAAVRAPRPDRFLARQQLGRRAVRCGRDAEGRLRRVNPPRHLVSPGCVRPQLLLPVLDRERLEPVPHAGTQVQRRPLRRERPPDSGPAVRRRYGLPQLQC